LIALISDIHGNYTALKEVLAEIDRLGITEVYCLGDVVGYYTQINECCDELRRRDVKSVMGNHDWYLSARSFCPRSRSVNDCLAYQKEIITEENLNWLSTFPISRTLGQLSMVHGGWTSPLDEYLAPTDEYFKQVDGVYFASGHSHRQMICKFDEKVYCNPGSVGQPRDRDPRAGFATFDGSTFQLYRVVYDSQRVGYLMEEAGFSKHYYACLDTGSETLGYVDSYE